MDLANEFSEHDRQLIIALTSRLTGSSPQAQPKLESSLVNIKRRMESTKSSSLGEYLNKVENSLEELAHFISAVTIHTTSWFRERPHFDRLRHLAMAAAEAFQLNKRNTPFYILSAGCSTGEEAYSMALVLEDIRRKIPAFDYRIEGWDVDLLSVSKASHAVYAISGQKEIPQEYYSSMLIGSERTQGYFTLDKAIRERCKFQRRSLISDFSSFSSKFDVIFCRNVLIYFSLDAVHSIIRNLIKMLVNDGHLFLGHSESINAEAFGLSALGNTAYKKIEPSSPATTKLNSATDLNTATNASASSMRRPEMVLIGASTGGTEVLVKMLNNIPQPCPPILVVQHISIAFAKSFAERLAGSSGLKLGDPTSGESLKPNHLYMALGDYHIVVKSRGGIHYLDISHQGLVHGVRPAVDLLFKSAVEAAKHFPMAAILLTGMGKDGASGLAELRKQGVTTYVQDEKSSVVFGMPREAIALGAAEFIGNPTAIRQRFLLSLKYPEAQRTAIRKSS